MGGLWESPLCVAGWPLAPPARGQKGCGQGFSNHFPSFSPSEMVFTMETREEGEDDSVTPSLSPSSRVRDDEGKVTGSVKSVEDVTSAELYGRGELSKAVVSVEDEWKTTQKAVQRLATFSRPFI